MRRSIVYGLFVVLILNIFAVSGYAYYVKASIKERPIAFKPTTRILDDDAYNSDFFNNRPSTAQQLEREAEAIVIARATTERQPAMFSILTNLQVLHVVKGDIQQTATMIEPGGYILDRSDYSNQGGYKLMEPNKTYLLFLRKLETNDKYWLPTSILYAKYELSTAQDETKPLVGEAALYRDVKHYGIWTKSPQIVKQYRSLRVEMLKRYASVINQKTDQP